MSLLWIDGFEGQDIATIYDAGTGVSFTTSTTTRFGYGRSATTTVGSTYIVKSVPASAEVYLGAAFMCTNMNGLLVFDTFSDAGASAQMRVQIEATGAISIRRGTAIQATSATGLVPVNQWSYIEIRYVVSAAASGYVEVRLNGGTTPVVTFTGVTKNSGTSTNVDQVRVGLGVNTGGVIFYLDDLYILNSLGTVNNTFLGERRVVTLSPNGPGSSTGFTPNPAGPNWQNVDELPPSSTDYNSATTVGTRDTYAMSDLPYTPTQINGVRATIFAHKSDANAASLKPAVQVGSTVAYGTATALPTAMASVHAVMETSPATSAAWTAPEVNGMEVGGEVA